METFPQSRQPEPPLARPDGSYYHLIHTVTRGLPPPVDASQEALDARNDAALAQIAAMQPVNANEAALAAQCVATRAHADDVLLSVREHKGDIQVVMRLNAQYASMVRASLAALGHLMRVQAVRHKREMSEPAANADAWAQHIATRQMQRALEGAGARAMATAAPSAAGLSGEPELLAAEAAAAAGVVACAAPTPAAEPSAPAVLPAAAPVATAAAATPALAVAMAAAATPPVQDEIARREALRAARRGVRWTPADDPPRDLAEEVEHYAAVYPKRVREIRHNGGLPPNCSFGPPDDALVRALVTGTSPVLLALDAVKAADD